MLERINKRLGFYEEPEEVEAEAEAEAEVEPEESETNSTEVPNLEKRDVSGQIADSLGFEDIFIMYDLCRYEQARTPEETSPWCAVFDSEDLKILEYYEDLKYWHKEGYFYELNTQFACPLMENLVETFDG